MQFFLDFLRQKVPKQSRDIPPYYRRALIVGEAMLAVYFALCMLLYPLINSRWEWVPVLFVAGAAGAVPAAKKGTVRLNLLIFAVLSFSWVWWNVRAFGWNSGTQHFLTLMLVLVFFNVYEKPLIKILWFFIILAFRVFLFSWSQQNPALYVMGKDSNTIYQTLNTITFFLILAAMCVIFSTSIQDTERQLRLRNQMLYKEAGTDPLTGLPNRRAMIEQIERFYESNPNEVFSVAIADIDFFKNVNDTYGHNCGDHTLVKLTELFTEHAEGQYSVCRWGGEEFCFFLPGKNLDEAGVIMKDLSFAVNRMELKFEGHELSITITAGVEEYDFSSPMDELLKSADEKLYMGKNNGRNQVVL